jgi:DNA-binding beta-propeller fold protein YncE
VPTGVLFWQGRLLVTDAWNHRVLVWRGLPTDHGQPADFALGQATLGAGELNRGGSPRADTLYWPYGLATDGTRLYVADSNNRRVLVWHAMPDACGQPADMVLGQNDFAQGEENAGGAPTAASMRWPHSIASDGARLLVADAGNNRVLVWNELPRTSNQPADMVLGQNDFAAVSDNQGYRLGPATLRFPYAVALWNDQIVVADTGNSRLMLWDDHAGLRSGALADGVFGQADFLQNGENRWKLAGRDTLCWPYGLSSCAGVLAIADSGNNRVLLWHGPGGGDD